MTEIRGSAYCIVYVLNKPRNNDTLIGWEDDIANHLVSIYVAPPLGDEDNLRHVHGQFYWVSRNRSDGRVQQRLAMARAMTEARPSVAATNDKPAAI